MKTIKCDVEVQYIGFVQNAIEKNTNYKVTSSLTDGIEVTSIRHFTYQKILNLGILIGKAIILKNWTENEKVK